MEGRAHWSISRQFTTRTYYYFNNMPTTNTEIHEGIKTEDIIFGTVGLSL